MGKSVIVTVAPPKVRPVVLVPELLTATPPASLIATTVPASSFISGFLQFLKTEETQKYSQCLFCLLLHIF